MRIISGKYKSRRLRGTPLAGIRPTSDKLKETVFNVLGQGVEGAAFLDACAGLGGMGIEALSRGASFVCFIEQSRKACQVIRENLKALEIREGFDILEMDLARALRGLNRQFDIVFADPPYDRDDLYDAILRAPVLAPGGLLIVEHSKRKTLPDAAGSLHEIRSLVQGDARLAFYRSVGGPADVHS